MKPKREKSRSPAGEWPVSCSGDGAGEAARPWYADGLRFSCTQCGRCCGGAPGDVWVSDQEIAALADYLGLDEADFRARYTRAGVERGVSLRDGGYREHFDCVFFEAGSGCTVYPLRPRQCRTWPFWQSVVATEDSWEESARDCPGMNRGTLWRAEIIASTAGNDGIA